MNEAIQQIVERVWVNQIGVPPEWSDQEAGEFFQTEADRLSEMIGQLQIETQHAVIREWRAAHHGAEPDYLTQVGLINSARAQAEEIVLSQELYEQIPEEDLTAQEQAAQEEWEAEVRERESYFRLPEGDDPESVRRRTDPDRWRGVWRTAASEENAGGPRLHHRPGLAGSALRPQAPRLRQLAESQQRRAQRVDGRTDGQPR